MKFFARTNTEFAQVNYTAEWVESPIGVGVEKRFMFLVVGYIFDSSFFYLFESGGF